MSYEKYVSETNIRKCQFYVRYMESRRRSGISVRDEFDWDNKSGNTSEICQWIDDELNDYYRGNKRRIDQFIEEMEAACKDELLPLTDFGLINDKRICLWAWYIKIGCNTRRNEVFPDHRGRFDALIKYFDELDCSGVRKKKILDDLRGEWQKYVNMPDPFAKDNEREITYRWDYAEKPPYNITRYFLPITNEDKKICLTGFYDAILDTPEKKELFRKKISSALSSQKTRDKKGRKNINKKFYISHENNEKLDSMVKHTGFNQDYFINHLISEEYNRQKTSSGEIK
ncbi:TPA: hypothetical protein R8G25_002810 [Citrobacter freundii]|nr:hypothetical protein [Citrobacter freundii]HEE9924903.1 hypothetical protein [Citrobacter freundii]